MEFVKQNFNEKVCVKEELMDAFLKTKDFEERAVIAGVIYRLEPLHRKQYDDAPSIIKDYLKWMYYDGLIKDKLGEEGSYIDERINKICEIMSDNDCDYLVTINLD